MMVSAGCGFPALQPISPGDDGESMAFDPRALTSFAFLAANNPSLSGDVTATIRGAEITAVLPRWTNLSSLVATFRGAAIRVAIAGVVQNSDETPNDFSRAVIYEVSDTHGVTGAFTVVASSPTLSARSDFLAVARPAAVVISDLDGDGKPDLVVASQGDADNSGISVMLNTTDRGAAAPSFRARADFAVGMLQFVIDTVVADFNGDGKPDIAAEGSTLSVWLNTMTPGATAPTLGPRQDVAPGGGGGLVTADFNGDGRPDVAFVHAINGMGQGSVSVLLNATEAGSSTVSFWPPVTFPANQRPLNAAVGDFNGDGKPDLAIANQGNDATVGGNTVTVYLNTTATNATTPAFALQAELTTDQTPNGIVTGDLDGDGTIDIAASTAESTISILLNSTPAGASSISFEPQNEIASQTFSRGLALADLDGDGVLDIVRTERLGNQLVVSRNTTPRQSLALSFDAPRSFPISNAASFVAIGDLNTDGRLDVVVANQNDAHTGSVSVMFGQ